MLGRISLGAVILVIIFAGLKPFNFSQKNQVIWSEEKFGLSIQGQSIVLSQEKFDLHSSPVSIELVFRIDYLCNDCVNVFLSFYDGSKIEPLLIGTWRSSVLIRARPNERNSHSWRRFSQILVDNVIKIGEVQLLTVTFQDGDASIYLDGALIKKCTDFYLFNEDEESFGTLIVGNSADGLSHWEGNILGLALYDYELEPMRVMKGRDFWELWINGRINSFQPTAVAIYLFSEGAGDTIANWNQSDHGLYIPDTFTPLVKDVLALPEGPYRFSRSKVEDVILNVLGFVPLGFILGLFISREVDLPMSSTAIVVLLSASGLSFLIELAQVFMPSRTSSMQDFILNSIGSFVGFILFCSLFDRK